MYLSLLYKKKVGSLMNILYLRDTIKKKCNKIFYEIRHCEYLAYKHTTKINYNIHCQF